MRERILETTKLVVEKSKHVKICTDAIVSLVERYIDWLSVRHFQQDELVPPLRHKELAEWIFVVEVLNHCFWPDPGEPKWAVKYRGRWYSGYWALEASLIRAVTDLGYPVHSAEFLANVRFQDLEKIFSGRGRIPMLRERMENLREAGRVLLESWKGSIVHVLEEAGGSVSRLIALLIEYFPSFRDETTYLGRSVYFFKRAQIFPFDLHARFNGRSWGKWHDLDHLTVFADYKLPQVLRHAGILVYDPDLAAKVDNLVYLPPGSKEEVEIRASTIQACELIREKVKILKGIELSASAVDYWLWSLGQENSFRKHPYHRTRTIFY